MSTNKQLTMKNLEEGLPDHINCVSKIINNNTTGFILEVLCPSSNGINAHYAMVSIENRFVVIDTVVVLHTSDLIHSAELNRINSHCTAACFHCNNGNVYCRAMISIASQPLSVAEFMTLLMHTIHYADVFYPRIAACTIKNDV